MLAVFSLMLFSDVALAQTFEPAIMKSLRGQEDLECPASAQSSSVLFCQASVMRSGRVWPEGTHCFGNLGSDDKRATQLRWRVLRSKFKPARVDERAVRVRVSFRVLFEANENTCNVKVIHNFGNEQDEFGMNYVAPQEIREHGTWFQRIWPPPRPFYVKKSGVIFAMSALVDEVGNASDVQVELENSSFEALEEKSIRALEGSHFIPGFVNGQAHEMRYFDYLMVLTYL